MSDNLPPLPEPAAKATWWQQNGFSARRIDVLKEHAQKVKRGLGDIELDLFIADQMRAYGDARAAAAAAAERDRCAKIDAPEHIPFNDDEWRTRCEIRDAILDA